jgi:hypothetical protein
MKHNYPLMATGAALIAAAFIPDPLDAASAAAGGAAGSIIPGFGTAAGAAGGYATSNIAEAALGLFLLVAGWNGETK